MQTCWTIEKMFPNANLSNYLVTIFGDGHWEITKWDLPDPKPTNEEVEAFWNTNQKAILDAHKPQPTEFDKLKKQHTDLMFQLMTKGVI